MVFFLSSFVINNNNIPWGELLCERRTHTHTIQFVQLVGLRKGHFIQYIYGSLFIRTWNLHRSFLMLNQTYANITLNLLGFFAECGGCKQKHRRENKLNNCNVCLYSAEDADKYISYWCLGKHHKCNNKGTAHNIKKGRIDWIIHIGWQMHIYVRSHAILTSFRLTHNVLLCVII